MKKLISLLLLFALVLALVGCPQSTPPTESDALVLTSPEADTYFCEANGVTYHRYPATFLPMSLGRKPYATYQNEHGVVLSFFSLSEGSEQNYLMLADPDDLYPYYMIVASDYHMPSLAEMNASQILICSAEEEKFWLTPNVYDQVRTYEIVRKISDAFVAGTAATLPIWLEEEARVELIFVSPVYPDFTYTCTYYEFSDGTCFACETTTGRCIQVESGLFDGYRLTPDSL